MQTGINPDPNPNAGAVLANRTITFWDGEDVPPLFKVSTVCTEQINFILNEMRNVFRRPHFSLQNFLVLERAVFLLWFYQPARGSSLGIAR